MPTDTPNLIVQDLELSSFVFDKSHPSLVRDRIGQWDDRDKNYDNRYDFDTFIYDTFLDEAAGEVVLVCPALFNFNWLLRDMSAKIDGQDVPLKAVEKLSRGNVIRFKAPTRDPKVLQLSHRLFSTELKVNRTQNDHFAGLNAMYAISKDNNLEWIADWLKYYVTEHGANAVVLFDNHSTDYSMDALKETLAKVQGLKAAAIVRAWFPFGPGGAGKTNFSSKFLHMTMVELGRRRLLKNARAVLNVDIDELVYARNGQTIFDATVASEQGYIRIDGQWAYADKPAEGHLIRHQDHQYIRSDGRPKVNRKWCVAPRGPQEGMPWLTHRIISRRDPTNPNFGFWHFRRISNNWDYDREDFDTELLETDERLTSTMARVF